MNAPGVLEFVESLGLQNSVDFLFCQCHKKRFTSLVALRICCVARWKYRNFYDRSQGLFVNITTKKKIGRNLRTLRENLGLSPKEFGKNFGKYSKDQIYNFEEGRSEVPLGLLLAIRGKGHPIEVLLGPDGASAGAISEAIGFLSLSKRKLSEAMVSAKADLSLLEDILNRLGLAAEHKLRREEEFK